MYALRYDKHNVPDMQRDYNDYGEDYSFFILGSTSSERVGNEEHTLASAHILEYKWMEKLHTIEREFGYNYNDTAAVIYSERHKNKNIPYKDGIPVSLFETKKEDECLNVENDSYAYKQYKKLKKQSGITDYQVYKHTGISTATLTSWKQGKYNVKITKLRKIADFFEVPVSYFFEDEEQSTYEKIKVLASNVGISIDSLEKNIGIAKGSLCKIDKHKPSYEKLTRIAEYLNVDIKEIAKESI